MSTTKKTKKAARKVAALPAKTREARTKRARAEHPDGPEVDGSAGFSIEAEYTPDGSDGDT